MTESSSYGGSAIRGARKTPGTTGKHKPTPSSSSTATYSGGRKLTSIPEEYGKSASYYDRGFYDYEHDPDAVTVEHRPVKSSNYDRASSRGSQTNKSWVTTIASRNSKLYRTVSNGFRRNSSQARSRQDDDYSYGQEYHQQPRYQETTPHPQDANTMTRQPSIARPPRSIHRPPSRSDLSYVSSVQPTGTYASSEIDYLDVGRRENPEYYYDGQSPSMMKNYQPSIDDRDRSRGIPRTYTEAYSIPSQGLPTQPPSPTMQQASPADRRGLKTPIHIRPQHHVAFLKEAMKSQDNHVAPYGYM
ncbi:hypothetical protein B0O80DRAFT_446559 [Mortierella sp. GBAus27b]|nr:hypothetical protein B0O80DRAFT_446559 [Mortierella sp. GBAus27b]